jgi:hypothetical protein
VKNEVSLAEKLKREKLFSLEEVKRLKMVCQGDIKTVEVLNKFL